MRISPYVENNPNGFWGLMLIIQTNVITMYHVTKLFHIIKHKGKPIITH